MLQSIPLLKIGAALGGLLLCTGAWSQAYPSKPIKLLVGYTAGGATDGVARVIATRLGPVLGQPVVIENKPGGGGTLATAQVAQSKPDGYTLLLGTSSSNTIAPFVYKSLAYDTQKDFTPVALLAQVPLVLVTHPGLVQGGLADLVTLAKKDPGKYAYASVGNGSSTHLIMEMFKQKAKIEVTHVPYKGSAPGQTDVIGGQVPMMMDTLQAALPFIKSGKVKALALSGDKRSELAPDIPTFAELGYPEMSGLRAWYGVMGPAGMPPEVTQKLATEIDKIVRSQEVRTQMLQLGAEPAALGGAAFAKFLESEHTRWGEAAKVSGAQVD
ncbi:tripartite tricarboxylate transporter substrate binding protein [Variovorax rhizosphaerae]|uniref:Tripartite tricarboxylate transporter substrate binding protein n=1 Tax=Variovorax rhizosphaerae TaxID=1836200 RepID=A0ABU8WV57_9BURK